MYETLQQKIESEGDFEKALEAWVMFHIDKFMDVSHWNFPTDKQLELKFGIAQDFWEVFTGRKYVADSMTFGQYYSQFVNTLNGNSDSQESHRRAEEKGQDLLLMIDALLDRQDFGVSSFGVGSPQRQVEIRKLVEAGILGPEPTAVLGGALPVATVDEFDEELKFFEREGLIRVKNRKLLDMKGNDTKKRAEERGINFVTTDIRKPHGVKADLFLSDLLLLGLLEEDGYQIGDDKDEVAAALGGISELLNPGGIAIMYDLKRDGMDKLMPKDVDFVFISNPLAFKARVDLIKWFLNPTSNIKPESLSNSEPATLVVMRKRDGSDGDTKFRTLYGLN